MATADNSKEQITTIRIGKDVHKKAKLKATEEGKTIKEYVEALIKKDVKKQPANNS
jgi:predicted HicB family RNase H-like nuclease